MTRAKKADGVIARAMTVGLFLSVTGSTACRCEDPPRPPRVETTSLELPPVVVPPPVEPPPERTRDGVEIARTLLRQLASPSATEPATPAIGEDLGLHCALGCALIDAHDDVVIVRPEGPRDDRVPTRLSVSTLHGTETARREIAVEGLDRAALAAFADEGGPPPWAPLVRRALGAGPYRPALDLVVSRARTIFSREEYAPLVALRAPLAERWLYAEIGPTAYRLHLLRVDRSVDRLLASIPLLPTACDAEVDDRACVAPMAIDGAVASPDGRTLHVLVSHPAAPGDGATQIVSVGLDDASALPSLYDEAAREAELERSFRAEGSRATPFAARAIEPASREARCLRGCALYRESGDAWIVVPSRIARGEIVAARVLSPGLAAAGLEVLGLEDAPDEAARASILARMLEEAPSRQGRPLVARQGISQTAGLASAATVELRAPHVGARISIDIDAGEYVIRWGRGGEAVEIARVPAVDGEGGAVAAPGILEVYAPPEQGFPLVILGVAPTRGPSHEEGAAHRAFHAIVTALPASNAAPAPRTQAGH